MILTPHLLVGAAIGAKVHSLWLVFVLATFFHFLLDRLPHWEYGPKEELTAVSRRQFWRFIAKALADLALGATLVFCLTDQSAEPLYIFFGAFVSLIPDGLVFLHFMGKIFLKKEWPPLAWLYRFHHKIHIPKTKNPRLWGFAIEGSIVLLAIFLSFK